MRIRVSQSTMNTLNRNADKYAADMMRLSPEERERRKQTRQKYLQKLKTCSKCGDTSEMTEIGDCVVCGNNKLPF